jgi:hypothetical protein
MSIVNVNRNHILAGLLPAGRCEAKIGKGGFLTKILKSTLAHIRAASKHLLFRCIFLDALVGGFQVASPVKMPVARKLAR